jgi:uncharacterized protein (TIGR02246 family)
MTRTALPLLLASAFLVSCGAPSADLTAEEKTIQALDEQWSTAASKNDVDATVSFYADDAVVLGPNSSIAKDKKSIRDGWVAMLAPGNQLTWKQTKTELAKSGELGYSYGTYQLTMKDPKGGPDTKDTGKFLEIWKKQADGKWKCIVDTYNSDLPPAPAPAPAK